MSTRNGSRHWLTPPGLREEPERRFGPFVEFGL